MFLQLLGQKVINLKQLQVIRRVNVIQLTSSKTGLLLLLPRISQFFASLLTLLVSKLPGIYWPLIPSLQRTDTLCFLSEANNVECEQPMSHTKVKANTKRTQARQRNSRRSERHASLLLLFCWTVLLETSGEGEGECGLPERPRKWWIKGDKDTWTTQQITWKETFGKLLWLGTFLVPKSKIFFK